IYELLGRKGAVAPMKMDVASLYEEGLRLHWARQWDEAKEWLERVLKLDPGDCPSEMLKKRIAGYQQNPPPAEWAGEYVCTVKD
ncbi:MAG: adenylate/guanylate cyclase domain-containing protein, partial [Kiritimatiellia bacterium]|nr:adenylate/guanylate cyclase domain-containing protein [Kiritimatiellia bacterium]